MRAPRFVAIIALAGAGAFTLACPGTNGNTDSTGTEGRPDSTAARARLDSIRADSTARARRDSIAADSAARAKAATKKKAPSTKR